MCDLGRNRGGSEADLGSLKFQLLGKLSQKDHQFNVSLGKDSATPGFSCTPRLTTHGLQRLAPYSRLQRWGGGERTFSRLQTSRRLANRACL